MGKDTKVVAHEGMDTGTGIYSKCGYENGHYSTLPIGYPLLSLHVNSYKLASFTTTIQNFEDEETYLLNYYH